MSNTSFNPFIAKKYGIIEAILIDTMVFWTKTNSAEGRNFHNERYWVFGTPEYFKRYFIYLSPHQIKYGFSNLVKFGAIIKDNFNKKGYDKTNWYSLSDSLLLELNLNKTCLQPASNLIEQICSIDRTNLLDASEKFVQPIPSTKPSTKQNNKYIVDYEKSTTKKSKVKDYEKDERFMRFYNSYPRHEQPRDAWKAFKSIVGTDDALLEHILKDLEIRKEKHTQWKDKQYIKLPAGYLRTGAFEGEIFNELEEQKQKQERDRIENERRLAEQAALSQKRADEIRQNDISKQSDAKTYRQVVKDAPRNSTERPVGLQNLIRSVGLNNNVNRK